MLTGGCFSGSITRKPEPPEPLEPEPSRRMTKCFYASFLASEAASADAASDSALVLVPVFQAMHAATFCGIPGFEFEPDESGHGGVFRFEDV